MGILNQLEELRFRNYELKSVALAALFCLDSNMTLKIISYNSPEYHEMLALRYRILREPLGLNFSEEDLQREQDDIFIACLEDGHITGCCILTRLSAEAIKLRQMAVDNHRQGKNVGRNIVLFAEQYATEHGYSTIKLNARKTAVAFYSKCGYTVVGEEFMEIGIPHFLMIKQL